MQSSQPLNGRSDNEGYFLDQHIVNSVELHKTNRLGKDSFIPKWPFRRLTLSCRPPSTNAPIIFCEVFVLSTRLALALARAVAPLTPKTTSCKFYRRAQFLAVIETDLSIRGIFFPIWFKSRDRFYERVGNSFSLMNTFFCIQFFADCFEAVPWFLNFPKTRELGLDKLSQEKYQFLT